MFTSDELEHLGELGAAMHMMNLAARAEENREAGEEGAEQPDDLPRWVKATQLRVRGMLYMMQACENLITEGRLHDLRKVMEMAKSAADKALDNAGEAIKVAHVQEDAEGAPGIVRGSASANV